MGELRAIIGGLAIAAAVSAGATSGPLPITQYETPAEQRWAPIWPDLPACDDPSVISTITSRFGEAENTYWGSAHGIDGVERVREIGFRANGLAYIPRRYCVARVAVADPFLPQPRPTRPHTVVYNVTAAEGIIGWTWGVDWCVIGFDREHAYEPACAVLRPILERWLGEPIGADWLRARY
jgi:hypothetical protein